MSNDKQIKVLSADDILAGLNSAVAEYGRDTTRDCYYAEYEWEGDRYPWGKLPDAAFDEASGHGNTLVKAGDSRGYEKGVTEWRQEHAVAPHCIVGVVLTKAGVPLSEMVKFEDASMRAIKVDAFEEYGIRLDDQAKWALELAQGQQDAGLKWYEAAEYAEREIEAEREMTEAGF